MDALAQAKWVNLPFHHLLILFRPSTLEDCVVDCLYSVSSILMLTSSRNILTDTARSIVLPLIQASLSPFKLTHISIRYNIQFSLLSVLSQDHLWLDGLFSRSPLSLFLPQHVKGFCYIQCQSCQFSAQSPQLFPISLKIKANVFTVTLKDLSLNI